MFKLDLVKAKKLKRLLGVLCLTLLFFTACKGLLSGNNEGVILYDVTYPLPNESNLDESLLPSTIEFYFDKNKTMTNISAGMGVFNTSIVTDFDKKQLTSALHIRMMGKKFRLDLNEQEIKNQLAREPKMEIKFLPDTQTIAGYLCKKATCSFPDGSLPDLNVFYTDAIQLSNPNWYSPYSPIKGVLMEFYIHRYGVHMKLRAREFKKEKVSADKFEIDSDFISISQKEMDEYYKI